MYPQDTRLVLLVDSIQSLDSTGYTAEIDSADSEKFTFLVNWVCVWMLIEATSSTPFFAKKLSSTD